MNVESIVESIKEQYFGVGDVNRRLDIIKSRVTPIRNVLLEGMPLMHDKYRRVLDEIIDIDLDFKSILGDKEQITERKERRMALARATHFFSDLFCELDNNLYLGFPKDGKLAGFIALYDHDTLAEVRRLITKNEEEYIVTAKHIHHVANHFKNVLNDKFEFEEFNLTNLCKEVSVFLKYSKKPEICSVQGDNASINANVDAVYEALFNIGKNGIYYGNKQIKFLVENNSNYILAKVIDAGNGIERKNRSKVKQMGVRLNNYSTGYGLGIATYAIETVHNGLITFRRSQDPQFTGNEARIFLPRNNSFTALKTYFGIRDRFLV